MTLNSSFIKDKVTGSQSEGFEETPLLDYSLQNLLS
jgi:hypothetical protein